MAVNPWSWLLGASVLGMTGRELAFWTRWTIRKRTLFDEARRTADLSGKPLLVVGRPYSMVGFWAHDCGDVCIDIQGCPECPGGLQGDVRDLSRFKDKQFGAIYVAHVFECLSGPDIEKAWKEVKRVADRIFIAHLPDDSLFSLFTPTVKSVIHRAPPTTSGLSYTDLATGRFVTLS